MLWLPQPLLPLLSVETLLKEDDGLALRKLHTGYVIPIIFLHLKFDQYRALPQFLCLRIEKTAARKFEKYRNRREDY